MTSQYYVGYDIGRHTSNHPRPITFRNGSSNSSPIQAKTGFLVIKNVTFWVDYKSIELAKTGRSAIFAYAVGEVISHGELELIPGYPLPTDLANTGVPAPAGKCYKLYYHPFECPDFYIKDDDGIKLIETAEQVRLEPSESTGHVDAWAYGIKIK